MSEIPEFYRNPKCECGSDLIITSIMPNGQVNFKCTRKDSGCMEFGHFGFIWNGQFYSSRIKDDES